MHLEAIINILLNQHWCHSLCFCRREFWTTGFRTTLPVLQSLLAQWMAPYLPYLFSDSCLPASLSCTRLQICRNICTYQNVLSYFNLCAFAPIVPLPEIALSPQCIHLMKTYSSLIYEAFLNFSGITDHFFIYGPTMHCNTLEQFRTYFLLQHYELLKGKEHVFSSLSPQCPAHLVND